MTTQTVRWLPKGEPIPEGWRKAGDAPAHHSKYSVLIEEVPAVAVAFPDLVFDRPAAEGDAVELVIVSYSGDDKRQTVSRLTPDKAIDLGLSLARRGWTLKMQGTP